MKIDEIERIKRIREVTEINRHPETGTGKLHGADCHCVDCEMAFLLSALDERDKEIRSFVMGMAGQNAVIEESAKLLAGRDAQIKELESDRDYAVMLVEKSRYPARCPICGEGNLEPINPNVADSIKRLEGEKDSETRWAAHYHRRVVNLECALRKFGRNPCDDCSAIPCGATGISPCDNCTDKEEWEALAPDEGEKEVCETCHDTGEYDASGFGDIILCEDCIKRSNETRATAPGGGGRKGDKEAKEIMDKYGLCGVAVWEPLAQIMNEEGNGEPSTEAIAKLKGWVDNSEELFAYMKKFKKYCYDVVWGCRKRHDCQIKETP